MPGRTDPLSDYRFRLIIEGIGSAGFKSVSGMGVDFGEHSYQEGGRNFSPRYFPNQVTFPLLTLSRGLSTDIDLGLWARMRYLTETAQTVVGGVHLAPTFMKRLMLLQVMNRQGNPTREFVFYDAWVKNYELGDLDATSDGVLLEKVQVRHNGWEDTRLSVLSNLTAAVIRL